MKYILALDIGTSSMRAVLYDSEGTALYSSGREYHSVFPYPSHVEQDPSTWSDAALLVLKDAAAYMRDNGIQAEGMAVTSQRSSLIPVDSLGAPLTNAIMWQDKRTIDECAALTASYGLESLYKKTGLRINPYFVLPKLMWLKKHRPDVFDAAHRFIGVQDYVMHFLTGRFVTDWSQACRTMLMNISDFSWDEGLLQIAGVNRDRLPELVAPGSVVGKLRAAIAFRTGLPSELPVVISGGDQQNAAVALGVVRSGRAEANTGTGSFVISYADSPVFDSSCRVLCQASAIAGKWVTEAGIFNTGAIYRWFKEQFCQDAAKTAQPYALMNEEAASSPVGANGVMLLPHFEGSAAPYWDPMSKGVFFNLSLGTKRADVLRSILEGISMELSDNLVLISSLTGDIDEVSVAGGMTRSDLFCTIQAGAFNRRVARYKNAEATSLGACIVAASSLGVYPDAQQAFEAMASREVTLFEPNEEDVIKYGKLMLRKQKLYFSLHESGVFPEFMDRL